MPWVAICERAKEYCGRNLDKTYINVIASTRQLQETANDFITNNPTHPWADSQFREFIVDITSQQAEDIRDGTNPLTWGRASLPRWQQRTDGSGETYEPGSWADPEDDQSVWSTDPLPDDRLIVRLYDDDPAGSGEHLAALDLDEDSHSGEMTIYLKLFTPSDSPSGTNAQDQKTEIAGKLMIFDFTSGVTTFGIKTDTVGELKFPSNHQYRVIGPGDETFVQFRVFGRSLRMES